MPMGDEVRSFSTSASIWPPSYGLSFVVYPRTPPSVPPIPLLPLVSHHLYDAHYGSAVQQKGLFISRKHISKSSISSPTSRAPANSIRQVSPPAFRFNGCLCFCKRDNSPHELMSREDNCGDDSERYPHIPRRLPANKHKSRSLVTGGPGHDRTGKCATT